MASTTGKNETSARTALAAQAERTAFTEKAVLDAAERVFARRGLDGTRVREIAETAGVNVATLYNYYASKSALYEAVLERGVLPLVALMERYAAGARELDATRRLVTDVMGHLAQHPHFPRLVYLEAMAEGDYLPELARKWFRPLLARIMAELEGEPATAGPGDGRAQPALEEGLHPLLAALFLHLSFGHFALAPLLREIFDSDPLAPDGVERQTRFIDALIGQLFPQIASANGADS